MFHDRTCKLTIEFVPVLAKRELVRLSCMIVPLKTEPVSYWRIWQGRAYFGLQGQNKQCPKPSSKGRITVVTFDKINRFDTIVPRLKLFDLWFVRMYLETWSVKERANMLCVSKWFIAHSGNHLFAAR